MQIKDAKYLLVIIFLVLGCTNEISVPNVTKMTFTYECWDWRLSFNVTADTTVKEIVYDDAISRAIPQQNVIVTPKALNNLTKVIYSNAGDSVPSNKLTLSSALRIQLYQEDNVIMNYYLQDTLRNGNYIESLIQDIRTSEYGCENVLVIAHLRKYKLSDSLHWVNVKNRSMN